MLDPGRKRDIGIAVLVAVLIISAVVGLAAWRMWGFIEWTTGGIFKPTWEDYEAMLATDALIGLTPQEASRLIEYPGRVSNAEGNTVVEYDLEHVGFFTWITAELDSQGRITRVELICD